jgi:hypothetical protein
LSAVLTLAWAAIIFRSSEIPFRLRSLTKTIRL